MGNCRYTLKTEYDDFGAVKQKTTPLGLENTYQYDRQDCLVESKEVGSAKKTFTYDQANRLISCKEPDTGKVVSTTYDSKGRVLAQTDFRGNKTAHTYDPFGNRKRTTLPTSLDEKGGSYTPTLTFDYDPLGNLILAEAPLHEKTQTSYNLFRKPTLIIQADDAQIRHTYNKNGTLEKTLYPDGTEVLNQFDLLKRQISKTVRSRTGKILLSEEWKYGSFQLLSHTDARGLKTEFTYDGAGRKIVEEAMERKATFTYDPLGFLERTNNGITVFVQKHNIEGLVEEQWEEDPSGQIQNWMQFSYDNENRKVQSQRKTSQGEAIDRFSYKNGKLWSHTDPLGHITRFEHHEFHQNELNQSVLQKIMTDPLGNATIETFDAGERLVSREKQNPRGETVFKESFLYDASGNQAKRISFIYIDGRLHKETSITWKYDAMGRVKEERESEEKSTFFDYDPRGCLACKTLPNGTQLHYAYDGADRLESLNSSDDQIHYQYTYETGSDPIPNLRSRSKYNPQTAIQPIWADHL